MDNFPKDPIMLLSVVNTRLRDYYRSLDELCCSEGIDRHDLERRLMKAGFIYNPVTNQFT